MARHSDKSCSAHDCLMDLGGVAPDRDRPVRSARRAWTERVEARWHSDRGLSLLRGHPSRVESDGFGHVWSSGHLMMQKSLPNGSCITAHSSIASPSMVYMSGGLITAPPISTIA